MTMRKIFTIIAISMFSAGCISAQTTEEAIKDIRSNYKEIHDNFESYSKKNIEVSDESTEGGDLTAYYNESDLNLIIVWLYGETGKSKTEFYYHSNELFFVFDSDYRYNVPIFQEVDSGEPFDENKTIVKENRYYFNNGNLIRWINPEGKQIDLKSEDFKDAEKTVNGFAERMKEKLD